MQAIFIFITILVLVSVSSATRPSDLIETTPLPSTKSLSGTTTDSFNKIDATHEPLGLWKNFEVPNVGHYSSWAVPTEQANDSYEGVPRSLLNFSNQIIPRDLTNSVGQESNSSEYFQLNGTIKNSIIGSKPSEINGTFVWY
jgi:hypothetical protein